MDKQDIMILETIDGVAVPIGRMGANMKFSTFVKKQKVASPAVRVVYDKILGLPGVDDIQVADLFVELKRRLLFKAGSANTKHLEDVCTAYTSVTTIYDKKELARVFLVEKMRAKAKGANEDAKKFALLYEDIGDLKAHLVRAYQATYGQIDQLEAVPASPKKAPLASPPPRKALPAHVRQTVWDRAEKIMVDNNQVALCAICKEHLKFTTFECGHIVSVKNGGSDEPENLTPMCGRCNRSLGAHNFDTSESEASEPEAHEGHE